MANARGRAPGDELVFMALGGIGEIGMNCYLYGLGPPDAKKWLMIDLGITFPEGENDPGIDVILPDLRFIEEERANLVGLLLTHAHEDHLGAVIELWPRLKVPIYATPFTAAMLKSKLADYGGKLKLPIEEVPLNARFDVGPFDLELIAVAHSIPESNAVALHTELGRRAAHGRLEDRRHADGRAADGRGEAEAARRRRRAGHDLQFHQRAARGPLALRDGRGQVARQHHQAARSGASPSRSSPPTSRASRRWRMPPRPSAGTSWWRAGPCTASSAWPWRRAICPSISSITTSSTSPIWSRTRWCCCAPAARASRVPRSRASPRTSIPRCQLDEGDLVIFSSRTIPGNERTVGRIQNRLIDLGCEIVTDGDALVHVTGHPRREELKEMYGWVKPRIAIPMHGEARHLSEHAKLARAAGVKEVLDVRNGDMVRLAPGAAEIIDEAPVGRLFRDGDLLVPSDDGPVRERRVAGLRRRRRRRAGAVGQGRGGGRCRDRARRRAGRRRRGAADGRYRARGDRGHHRQHSPRPAPRRGDGARGRAPGRALGGGARLGQAPDRQGADDARAAMSPRANRWMD